MAPKIHFPLLYFFFVFLLYSCVIEQPTAFTIKLIHRYAPESPFYNPNLTDYEIVEKLNFQTRSRKMGNGTLLDLQTIRPHLSYDFPFYLVKVSLGTFLSFRGTSHKSYYLFLDTGSSVTWMQCEDCKKSRHHCYRQSEPPFPNSKSRSYRPLSCNNHPLCFPNNCIGDSCSYHVICGGPIMSIGILAHEKFAFSSNNGREEIVPLVFGCGIENHTPNGEHRDLITAGILGLGVGPLSFVTQTNSITHGRFSYCLPPRIQAARGSPIFLRFGSDIPSYSTLPGTILLRYLYHQTYNVDLLDIAINGTRLNIPYSYFQKGGPDVGGTIFDSGSPITRISPPAYRMVKQAVERHIARYLTNLAMVDQMFGFDLCYRTSKPFRGQSNLPFITFHFEGSAHLVVKPDIAFDIIWHDGEDSRYEHICLSMLPSDARRMTIIGSDLQANQFIVYDVTGNRIYFSPRDCSHDN